MAKRRTGAVTDKNCKEISDLLLDYVNQSLPPPLKRDFDRHLKICPDCVSFLNTYRKTIDTTQSVPVEAMPEKVRQTVLDFLRQRIRKITLWVLTLASSFAA